MTIGVVIVAHNLELSGKRISMRDCLAQIGLWTYLWEIILVILIVVGRSILSVGSEFLKRRK